MNSHYLLDEAREHALTAARIITDIHNGPEAINRQDLDHAIQRLRLAIELLQDETVDFEIGETDDGIFLHPGRRATESLIALVAEFSLRCLNLP